MPFGDCDLTELSTRFADAKRVIIWFRITPLWWTIGRKQVLREPASDPCRMSRDADLWLRVCNHA